MMTVHRIVVNGKRLSEEEGWTIVFALCGARIQAAREDADDVVRAITKILEKLATRTSVPS
jgi:hypothetical protein